MEQDIVYNKNIIEFVKVAKEYCEFVESVNTIDRKNAVNILQKFLPLIYLKGCMIEENEPEGEGLLEYVVTEYDYNHLLSLWQDKMGEYDEYLEVFDRQMQYSEAPIPHHISEKVCDIYQSLKNFIHTYSSGIEEAIEEAIFKLSLDFEEYWGKSSAELIRAIHNVIYLMKEQEDNDII